MRFVNDKELWQDNQVRLNIHDPEIVEGEKVLGTFRVETTKEPEMGNLVATNIRIYFRSILVAMAGRYITWIKLVGCFFYAAFASMDQHGGCDDDRSLLH